MKLFQTNMLREKLVLIALEWQEIFGNAPSITAALSEYDAARLVGMSDELYSAEMKHHSVVTKGFDFRFGEKRYQVKACRPSGRPGSKITNVPKANNYEWDYLVWIMYNQQYEIEESWLFDVEDYRQKFASKSRLSPADMRSGTNLLTRSVAKHVS